MLLAEWIGVWHPRLNEIIHGKRGVSPDTTLRLQQVFGMEAQFWLKLQMTWNLWHAQHSRAAKDIKSIRRRPALARAG